MADEHLIKLLEEIRDLQKQQIENSRQAIANQQHAIETQKQAVRRGRSVLILVGVIVLAICFLPVFWWTLGWGSEVRTATLALKGHLVSSCSNAMF